MRKISASFSIFAYMNKKLVILEEKKCLIVKFKLFVETGAQQQSLFIKNLTGTRGMLLLRRGNFIIDAEMISKTPLKQNPTILKKLNFVDKANSRYNKIQDGHGSNAFQHRFARSGQKY